MYDLLYLGASELLRYKRDFVICNFAESVKFIKKYIECLPGIPKCVRDKPHFVISVININMFYCIRKNKIANPSCYIFELPSVEWRINCREHNTMYAITIKVSVSPVSLLEMSKQTKTHRDEFNSKYYAIIYIVGSI